MLEGLGGGGYGKGFSPGEPIASAKPDIENNYQGGHRHSSALELRSWFSPFTSERFQECGVS